MPKIAVFVEPINFIAILIVSIEMIVGKIDNIKRKNKCLVLSIISRFIPNLELKTYTNKPNNIV